MLGANPYYYMSISTRAASLSEVFYKQPELEVILDIMFLEAVGSHVLCSIRYLEEKKNTIRKKVEADLLISLLEAEASR